MGYYSDEMKSELVLQTVKDETLADEVAKCVSLEDFQTVYGKLAQLGLPAHVFAYNDNFLNHQEFALQLMETEPNLCLILTAHQGSVLPDELMWYAMNDELCSGAAFRYCENSALLERAWNERIFQDTLDYSSWLSNVYTPESCLVDFVHSVYLPTSQVETENNKGRKPTLARIPAGSPDVEPYNVVTTKKKRPSPLDGLSYYVTGKKPVEWNFSGTVLSAMAEIGSTLFLSIAYRKELDPKIFGQSLYRLSQDEVSARETYLFFRDYSKDKQQPGYTDKLAYYILKTHYEGTGNGDIDINLFPSDFLTITAVTYLRTQAKEPIEVTL